MMRTGLHDFSQGFLHLQRIRCGQPGGVQVIDKAVAECAEYAAVHVMTVQRLRDGVRNRGFAVGAGDANHMQPP